MARHSCSHPFALAQAGLSWVPPLCNWEQQIHGQTLFPLEKSRLRVLIRFSTHELIAQHRSKHQHFYHYLALILLSPPLHTKCCWQRVPAPRGNHSSSLRMGRRGAKTGKCAQKRWLSPFQLPSQITSQKTHPCTFTFPFSFSPAFHSYKTSKNHSIARLFLFETSSANLCFSLLKIGFCSTNKGYRNSLVHCQN